MLSKNSCFPRVCALQEFVESQSTDFYATEINISDHQKCGDCKIKQNKTKMC